jgi:hypothetical protein
VRYYLDATVYKRLRGDFVENHALEQWLANNEAELVTSILSKWEVCELYAMMDRPERTGSRALVATVPEVPITGKALEIGSYAVAAMGPYAALHVGIAAASPEVSVIVTYDPEVASASRLYGLTVLSPGRADEWYVS